MAVCVIAIFVDSMQILQKLNVQIWNIFRSECVPQYLNVWRPLSNCINGLLVIKGLNSSLLNFCQKPVWMFSPLFLLNIISMKKATCGVFSNSCSVYSAAASWLPGKWGLAWQRQLTLTRLLSNSIHLIWRNPWWIKSFGDEQIAYMDSIRR